MPSKKTYKKVVLVVLDGFGLAEYSEGNAILQAGMPFLDSLVATYPAFALAASGLVVGLPWGQAGNSEVGHSALGTGRIVVQDLAHINNEIRSGDFYKNPAFLEAIAQVKKHDSTLHLMGCTSPGGIHAHSDHLIALLELAHRHALKKVRIHFITDGEDMPAKDALNVLDTLEPHIKRAGARIATISGRSFAMDRLLNWKLTQRVWQAVVDGNGEAIVDVRSYITKSYEKDITDYDLEPATVLEQGKPVGRVEDNDALIFFDFRNDRMRQLAVPFVAPSSFQEFTIARRPANLKVVTMTRYSPEFEALVAYSAPDIPKTLGEVISEGAKTQWRIAEKEKEAHVTNFFNGGRLVPYTGEQRCIVASRFLRGDQYLVHPEMSAQGIVDALRERIEDPAQLYVVNFANADMIGHTGNLAATKRALRILDGCIQQITQMLLARDDCALVITADHGNAEELLDPLTGGEDMQHSTRAVPALMVVPHLRHETSENSLESLATEAPQGTLIDVAPTILELLGSAKPREMTGASLLSMIE